MSYDSLITIERSLFNQDLYKSYSVATNNCLFGNQIRMNKAGLVVDDV
ncbi:hypothetical protein [Brasilonema sp. UFV-L1]|nr:hypothetical protein [Brasilonema sp. UFV-L1]